MHYALFLKNELVHVVNESPFTGTPKLKDFPGIVYDRVEDHWDWNLIQQVEKVAAKATECFGKLYLPTERSGVGRDRFNIVEAPVVGDEVSYAFNGDSYPDGTIVSVSKSFKKITTSTGNVYFRSKNSGCWLKSGGTWSMVAGHVRKQNPEF